MAANFQPNSSAFRAMAVGPEIRAAVTAAAERAVTIAKGLAQDFRVSGEYIDGLQATTTTTHLTTGFGSHDVAAGIVNALSPHSAAVEWGNDRDHRPHHVLTRTLEALGDD